MKKDGDNVMEVDTYVLNHAGINMPTADDGSGGRKISVSELSNCAFRACIEEYALFYAGRWVTARRPMS